MEGSNYNGGGHGGGGSGGGDQHQQYHQGGGGGRPADGQGGSYRPQASQGVGPTRSESCESSRRGSTDKKLMPMKRPDSVGSKCIRTVNILVNHFPVKFNPEAIIIHYDVDMKPKDRSEKIPKSNLCMIMDKLFYDDPAQFPSSKIAYDGEKKIYSAVTLPTGKFKVELFDGEGMKSRSYMVTLKFVKELKLCKLEDYLNGNLLPIPCDILQGMDVVMKENSSRQRISVGQSFFPTECNEEDDLGSGITASRGFQQSLKPTSQGLVLCLDYSVSAFHKQLPVIDFLGEHIEGFSTSVFGRWIREVMNTLQGLKVTVTTKQKFTIAGLTDQDTRRLSFDVEDPEGKIRTKKVDLVDYFKERYGKEIMYKDIPCLDLGKNNYAPMEFCILVEGQRYPKDNLDRNAALFLKNMSVAPPNDRKKRICEMMEAEDGPCGGDITQNFNIIVGKNMREVEGRVLRPPKLKLRYPNGKMKSVVDGIPVAQWALLDFSLSDHSRLIPGKFIQNLRNRCKLLGIRTEKPLVCRPTRMSAFSDVTRLRQLFESVIKEANEKCLGRLQIIVCVITREDPGYKYLKWISETKIGIITQCCSSIDANKGHDHFFTNLALNINAKLGGSNVELVERLPGFEGEGHVMFVGSNVNHPSSWNSTCPSISSVVASVNWPAANRYAARICPQDHRTEKILNFGNMCLDLVRSYAQLNKVKPEKIVVFRDGVGEGQFDMVLNEELVDLKNAIYTENYRPTITPIVAQKRHQTHLFPKSQRDESFGSNVPCGTVVDTTIVNPFEFDFYLCSHDGGLGTSKPTHYHVLWDEHNFTSDQLQQLIYNLCFTYARCTKPVSLVPPVYYADIVAYRGHMYQEVVKELQYSPASMAPSSSSRALSSSKLSSASFDEKLYKLHPDLVDTMFFV